MALSGVYLYQPQIYSKHLGVLGRFVSNHVISKYALLMLPKSVTDVEF